MKKKEILKISLTVFITAVIITALSAFLPIPPFTFTDAADLQPLNVGWPVSFVTQTMTSEELKTLTDNNINNSFVLPRYDKYTSSVSILRIALCLLSNIAVCLAVFAYFKYAAPHAKKALFAVIPGAVITVASMFLPVFPGTFSTVNDLSPMHFGFPLSFVEQTPNINTIITDPDLEQYISQSFIAPNYSEYTTRIVLWKLLLSFVITSAVIFAIVRLFQYAIKKLRRKA